MVGSMSAFVGNAAMGAIHDATGTFTLPLCLMGAILLFGTFLTLTFREPGDPPPYILPHLCSPLKIICSL